MSSTNSMPANSGAREWRCEKLQHTAGARRQGMRPLYGVVAHGNKRRRGDPPSLIAASQAAWGLDGACNGWRALLSARYAERRRRAKGEFWKNRPSRAVFFALCHSCRSACCFSGLSWIKYASSCVQMLIIVATSAGFRCVFVPNRAFFGFRPLIFPKFGSGRPFGAGD